jgi:hypothetical protein
VTLAYVTRLFAGRAPRGAGFGPVPYLRRPSATMALHLVCRTRYLPGVGIMKTAPTCYPSGGGLFEKWRRAVRALPRRA